MTQQGFNFSIDLVKVAEALVNSLEINRKGNEMLLTYAQLRKVLSSVVAIKNKLSIEQANSHNFDVLPEDIVFDIKFLKTSLLYQAGRIGPTEGRYPMKTFVEKSKILLCIDNIGNDVKRFEFLCKYVEAIVAFYKYRAVTLKNN